MDSKTHWQAVLADLQTNYVPAVSIDCVIFGFHEGQLKVLLLRWKGTDDWSLPGGRIQNEENLDEAAHRGLRERTGLGEIFLQQFHTFGDVARMTRMPRLEGLDTLALSDKTVANLLGRVMSVGYYALVDFATVTPTPDVFTDECRWWDAGQIPSLLFDHNLMVEWALKTLRHQLSYQPIGYNLLPDKFTMPDLQQLYETILGQSLDRRNFQKRMLGYGILERLAERKTKGAHKAPYLYRFDTERYQFALQQEQLMTD